MTGKYIAPSLRPQEYEGVVVEKKQLEEELDIMNGVIHQQVYIFIMNGVIHQQVYIFMYLYLVLKPDSRSLEGYYRATKFWPTHH